MSHNGFLAFNRSKNCICPIYVGVEDRILLGIKIVSNGSPFSEAMSTANLLVYLACLSSYTHAHCLSDLGLTIKLICLLYTSRCV